VIEFALPSAGEYRFEIYNLLGQLVHSEAALAAAGTQQLRWQGTDSRGKAVASGVYLYRLSFAGNSLTRKLVLLK
jgi:flagellar hook assembly protein FlgD